MPTASAVLGDLIDAARNLARQPGAHHGRPTKKRVRPIDEGGVAVLRDVRGGGPPCVLAAIAAEFGDYGACQIKIHAAAKRIDDDAGLIFVTHRARERDSKPP